LLPPDEEIPRQPTACRRCGEALAGCDPQPLRHQVIEWPPLKPLVTEYQLHRLVCPRCGTSTGATLPDGVPTGQQGPRLQGLLAVLTGAYRLSKDQAETLCADLFASPLGPGTVCHLEQQTTAALEPVVEELRVYVKTQHANMDETGWREEGKRAWLWVAVTALVAVFHICRAGQRRRAFLVGSRLALGGDQRPFQRLHVAGLASATIVLGTSAPGFPSHD
jgi:transposase